MFFPQQKTELVVRNDITEIEIKMMCATTVGWESFCDGALFQQSVKPMMGAILLIVWLARMVLLKTTMLAFVFRVVFNVMEMDVLHAFVIIVARNLVLFCFSRGNNNNECNNGWVVVSCACETFGVCFGSIPYTWKNRLIRNTCDKVQVFLVSEIA